jgi:hypothetical protein
VTDSNVVSMPEPMDKIGKRIDAGFARAKAGDQEWIEGSIDAALALVEARDRHSSDDIGFHRWLVEGEHDHVNKDDRAALIKMGRDPRMMRIVLEETDRRSYQHIWNEHKNRFLHVKKPTPEKSLPPKPEVSAPVTRPVEKIVLAKPVVETQPAEPTSIETFPVSKGSKLNDLLPAKVATVLQERFKHARMFIKIASENEHSRNILSYLAKRCVEPDYPEALFYAKAWTLQLLYPHLPQKYLDNKNEVPPNLATLYGGKAHKELVETERFFKSVPEFASRFEKPALACNTVHAIRSSLRHSKNGHAPDPAAVHHVTYADDEGKPQAIVRGTQVWPAESGAGYSYNDLRCACGLAGDILCTFGESRDAPISTQVLKLRHIVSWFPGGYNAHGATFEGIQRAFNRIIHAYTLDKSEVTIKPITLS